MMAMSHVMTVLSTIVVLSFVPPARAAEVGTVHADPRNQATGGVNLVDGSPGSILFAPEQLGFAEASGLDFGRSIGLDVGRAEISMSTLGWSRVSRSSATGFALDLRESTALDRSGSRAVRAAWGVGRPFASSRLAAGLSVGTRFAEDSGSSNLRGYSAIGIAWVPSPEWRVAQNASIDIGDTYGEPGLANEEPAPGMAWSTGTHLRWTRSTWGLSTGLEYRSGSEWALGRSSGYLRWGLSLDPTRLAPTDSWARRFERSAVEFGIDPDGVRYGLHLQFADTGLSLSRARIGDDAYTVIGLQQRWGHTWSAEAREQAAQRTHSTGKARSEARDRIRVGAYEEAQQLLLPLLESEASRTIRSEIRAELEEVAELIEVRNDAAVNYPLADGIGIAGHQYARLSTRSPDSEEFANRRAVCQLLGNARAQRVEGNHNKAWTHLRAAFDLDPGHPLVTGWMLEGSPYLTANLLCPPLHAALHGSYLQQSPIELHISNAFPFALDSIQVEYGIEGFVDGGSRVIELPRFPGNRDSTLVLPLTLDQVALNEIVESREVALHATLRVRSGVGRTTVDVSRDVTLHGPRVLDWRDPRQFGAAISASKTDVQRLLTTVPAEFTPSAAASMPRMPENAIVAMGIFHLFQLTQIEYGEDRPIIAIDNSDPVYDRLRTPADVFADRVGDCEDLVALWLTLLEARSIETRYVVERVDVGHVMLLFDLDVPPSRSDRLCGLAQFAVERDGRLWLPIEATARRGGFVDAVEAGFAFVTDPEFADTREEFVLSEVRRAFPPMSWPREGLSPEYSKEQVRASVASEIERERATLACELDDGVLVEGMGDRVLRDLVIEADAPRTKPVVPESAEVVTSTPAAASAKIDVAEHNADAVPERVEAESIRRPLVPCEVRSASTAGNDNVCVSDLSLGVHVAVNGKLRRSEALFLRAMDCEITRAATLCNLGNVALLQYDDPDLALDLYDCAESLDRADTRIRMNKTIAHLVLASRGKSGSREEAYRLATLIRETMSLDEALSSVGLLAETRDNERTSSEAGAIPSVTRFLISVYANDAGSSSSTVPTTALGVGDEEDVIYWKEVGTQVP